MNDMYLRSAQRTLLDRLKPAARSHYANTAPCQDGTRKLVFDAVSEWSQDQSVSGTLLWLYGQAGMGKSTIAASVCRKYDQEKKLGAHFFCKRDDPELRSPERILNTIVYRLASRLESYGLIVAGAIKDNTELPESPLEQRYTHLIERPLEELKSKRIAPAGVFFVVVDALDECEAGGGRRLLLNYLRKMTQIVPWLKVVVTSRPEQDIERAFRASSGATVSSLDLVLYDASEDIIEYTRKRMAGITEDKGQAEWSEDGIRQLSDRACGLFIWAETACAFIGGGHDMDTRLKQVLDGTQSAQGSKPLDMLYTTAINLCVGDHSEDNVKNVKQCLGIIVATAGRTPLSVANLELLLSGWVASGVFRSVVKGLGSVLYEDGKLNDAVRVYHPSFADFILDPSRSNIFHANPEEHNAILAECCLGTMMRGLKFNICQLETSYVLNRDIADLETRVQTRIGRHLQYSCLHWSSHLTDAPKGILGDLLGRFLYGPVLLYWIEALSLLSRLDVAILSLLSLAKGMSVSILSE